LTRAYVGLGANLGDRTGTIRRAVELLGAEPGIEVVAVSTLRETEPVGYVDQPAFLNGAAALETVLSPRELLERLLAVELALGRVRGEGPRFGPRAIDLDLLLYGDEVVNEPGLIVPHPRLPERRFALEPLHELDPDLSLPDGRAVQDLLGAQLQ
jgi:2-amino-4-hydroxy-6-hydroxymethyldihydropteridine diphosphokinase